jgi:capsular exopolysaccharide synthesis family protein
MSKVQSNIQKAIEKARNSRKADDKRNQTTIQSSSGAKKEGISSGVFRIPRTAMLHQDIMEQSRIVSATDDRAARSAYNVLRTRVLQRIRANDWSSILVTSPSPGEGKTLTASNLAMSLARDENQSAILVDLDLMRSSVAKYLGIDVDIEAGVGDFLKGDAKFSDILYSLKGIDRLTLIPNREPVENSSDLLGSPRMKELVANLHEQSDRVVVVYDMPPLLAHDDALVFCPNVDAVLLVVAQGKTDRAALDKAMMVLSDFELLGVVMNMSNEATGDSAYAYY